MTRRTLPRSKAGHAATVALGVLAAGGAVAAVALAIPSSFLGSAAPSTTPMLLPPSADEFAGALARAGLTPESLAAAGVNGSAAAAVYSAAGAHLEEHIEALRSADDALADAHAQHGRLRQQVQSGRGSAEDVAALGSAGTTLAAAQAAVDAAIDSLFDAATEGLASGAVATLRTVQANRTRGLPTRYLAQERTDAEWLALRDALSNARIAAARGEEPCDEGSQVCLSADSASATAAANLQANLAGVRSAWDASLTR